MSHNLPFELFDIGENIHVNLAMIESITKSQDGYAKSYAIRMASSQVFILRGEQAEAFDQYILHLHTTCGIPA